MRDTRIRSANSMEREIQFADQTPYMSKLCQLHPRLKNWEWGSLPHKTFHIAHDAPSGNLQNGKCSESRLGNILDT